MTTHRVTAADFDILIGHWAARLAKLAPGTPVYDRTRAKLEELREYRRQEFGAEQDQAWQAHGG